MRRNLHRPFLPTKPWKISFQLKVSPLPDCMSHISISLDQSSGIITLMRLLPDLPSLSFCRFVYVVCVMRNTMLNNAQNHTISCVPLYNITYTSRNKNQRSIQHVMNISLNNLYSHNVIVNIIINLVFYLLFKHMVYTQFVKMLFESW